MNEEQLQNGHYSNTNCGARQLTPRDKDRQNALATLQEAINDGLNSGIPEPFDPAIFCQSMRAKYTTR
jgi:antitoxin ParD1/3/4